MAWRGYSTGVVEQGAGVSRLPDGGRRKGFMGTWEIQYSFRIGRTYGKPAYQLPGATEPVVAPLRANMMTTEKPSAKRRVKREGRDIGSRSTLIVPFEGWRTLAEGSQSVGKRRVGE